VARSTGSQAAIAGNQLGCTNGGLPSRRGYLLHDHLDPENQERETAEFLKPGYSNNNVNIHSFRTQIHFVTTEPKSQS
jgi:hypothetical protein